MISHVAGVTLVLEGLSIIGLGVISVQDWRWRAVDWYLFPGLFIVLVLSRLFNENAEQIFLNIVTNTLLLSIQVGLLALYIILRFKGRMLEFIGLGDLLFWVLAAAYLRPFAFLIYFLVSLIIALLVAFLLHGAKDLGPQEKLIPLAGVQAACLIVVILTARIWPAASEILTDWELRLLG